MTQSRRPKAKPRRTWIPIVLVLAILAGAGYGYYAYTKSKAAVSAQSAAPTFNTTQVRSGNITLSAAGTGSLAAGSQNNLSFAASGTVAKVNVQAGDQVKQGQVLAELGNQDSLQANVSAAQQDLNTAQQALDTLKASATANIANAQLTISNDQKALDTAKSTLIQPGMARCDQATTDAYYSQWDQAKKYLVSLGDGGGNAGYYLNQIVPAKNKVAQAYAAYQWCTGFTDYELNASQAKYTLAQTQLATDQATLATLQKNNGVDPTALAQAQNKVDNAQAALDQAQTALDGATIKAPYDGVILSVAGQPGDTVGTDTFITMADLAHPQVTFSIDETDLNKVALNEQATVVFDALPNETFTGKVIRVNPSLVTSNNVQVVQGTIQLDLSKVKNPPTLLQGLNATVTLIKAQANNVLIVPQQAVRDLGDGTYGVFVVGSNNQPTLKIVQVGLQDAANVEITSGLTAGQTVSTGTAQIRNANTTGGSSTSGGN